MTVYAVFEVEIDPHADAAAIARYDEYRAAVPALIARHGGEYLVRAGSGRALEGPATSGRWHLVAFPDAESAEAFWASEEYRALQPLRHGAADVRAVLIGAPPADSTSEESRR